MILAYSTGPAEAATTFTVNDAGDGGDMDITDDRCDSEPDDGMQCTLRAAIQQANDTAGADAIEFDIGDTNSVKTISPASELPNITDAVTIDGYTQQGASENNLAEGNDAVLKVQLDGLDAGTGADGLRIEAADCTIKGLVIRRFGQSGITISSSGATGNRVQGNFIGTNAAGTADRGNGVYGVYVLLNTSDNTIGGTQPDMRNVISGNDDDGIEFNDSTGNKVQGNHIGTTADGTADLGNDDDGVSVVSDDNTIGGTASGAGNVISGNDDDGVGIFSTAGNRVEGNYVGTRADGSGDLGNAGDGVQVFGAESTAVGGTLDGAANRIAHNGADGVRIFGSDAAGNNVLSNSIFSNGGLGIDLAGGTEDADGVTSNDTGDPDTGPNTLQNFPTISSATRNSATRNTTISGRLNSNPSQDFVVQCFLTTNRTHASAHGEGLRLLDTTIASTNANGNVRFSCTSSLPLLGQVPGRTVSATATNIVTGDTSEFSKNKTVTPSP